jgi:hypothetical protein
MHSFQRVNSITWLEMSKPSVIFASFVFVSQQADVVILFAKDRNFYIQLKMFGGKA